MSENKPWLTVSEASMHAGRTGRTILNMIHSGKLTASKEHGIFYIEKSEFFRVFPNAFVREKERSKLENNAAIDAAKELIEKEVKFLKEMNAQKDKEVEFLRKQMDSMLEAIKSQARLLEYKHTKSEN